MKGQKKVNLSFKVTGTAAMHMCVCVCVCMYDTKNKTNMGLKFSF